MSSRSATEGAKAMDEKTLLTRITVNPAIFGGKPIIRGRRLAVEHLLGMLAAGDTPETILEGYPWLEPEDIQACLVYARRLVSHERVEPLVLEPIS
jgi:uncharacterized protein (DUF433 family)